LTAPAASSPSSPSPYLLPNVFDDRRRKIARGVEADFAKHQGRAAAQVAEYGFHVLSLLFDGPHNDLPNWMGVPPDPTFGEVRDAVRDQKRLAIEEEGWGMSFPQWFSIIAMPTFVSRGLAFRTAYTKRRPQDQALWADWIVLQEAALGRLEAEFPDMS
jgi:hypothetical protein